MGKTSKQQMKLHKAWNDAMKCFDEKGFLAA